MKETVFEKYTISKDTIIVEGNEKNSIRIENNLIEQNYFYFIKIHIFPTITISSVRIEIYITIYHRIS